MWRDSDEEDSCILKLQQWQNKIKTTLLLNSQAYFAGSYFCIFVLNNCA